MFRLVLGICVIFFCSSCTSDGGDEDKGPRHPEYRENEYFSMSPKFDYSKKNKNGLEGTKRSEEDLLQHRPVVSFIEYGEEVVLKFPLHPHDNKHYWSWMEVVDFAGNEVYQDVLRPENPSKDYEFVLRAKTPFNRRWRVRCFCQVHGEFIDYVDVPKVKKKPSILEREAP